MTDHTSSPFAIAEFQQDILKQNKRKILLHWATHELWVAFLRDASGHEQPAVIQLGSQRYYAASPNADFLQTLFTSAQLEEGSEIVIKSLSLSELARNAENYHFGIYLSNEHIPLTLMGYITKLMGETTILDAPQGKEIIYQATVFPFEPADEADTLPYGTVQYWNDTDLDYDPDRDLSNVKSLYVFDDQLDWSNPLFPDLPDTAMPLSQLPPNAQSFFERIRAPLLPNWDAPAETPATPESSYQNSLMEKVNLTYFKRLRALINQDFVPAAGEISLTVTQAARLDDETADTPEDWETRIDFTMPMGAKALFEIKWVNAFHYQTTEELPDTIGTHRASEALRERIVNHIAWMLFQDGRDFDLRFLVRYLPGLFPGMVLNSDRPFQPDYADSRFPCLARFQCDEHEVPVLLLKQQKNQYICQPLRFMEIPEEDVSPLIPNRRTLIDPDEKIMPLSDLHILTIPTSLIDFPDHWYSGIRVSNQHLRTGFINTMRIETMMSKFKDEEEGKGSNTRKWAIACCGLALIGVIAMLGSL